jgi:hypothetical protein
MMSLIFADVIRDATRTHGIATFNLFGARLEDARPFNEALTNGQQCYYRAMHRTEAEWEIGIATYEAPNRLQRTTILRSSNNNAPVYFSVGVKDVYLTVPAARTVALSADGLNLAGGDDVVAAVVNAVEAGIASDPGAQQTIADAIVDNLIFTPQAPFIATRPLGEKVGEVISIRDVGAPTTSVGQPDYTTVLENAGANIDFKTIEIPHGLIRLDGCALSGRNAVHVRGQGRTQTTIRAASNDDALVFTNANFCDVSGLSVQHEPSATGGRGIVFDGTSSSCSVDDLFVALNPDGGVHFLGVSETPQSENQTRSCLFQDNGGKQLFYEHSNDYMISNNRFGRFSLSGFPTHGAHILNSSAGTYLLNKHWNNVNAAVFENANFMRIVANRFEESRNEGVILLNAILATLGLNHYHTNSQSNSGNFSALQISNSARIVLSSEFTYSWDAENYLHKNGIEVIDSDNVHVFGGFHESVVGDPISFNAGSTNYTYDVPGFGRLSRTQPGSVANATDHNNPSASDWASIRDVYRVNGAARAVVTAQRAGNTAGGFFVVETADSDGVMQFAMALTSAQRLQCFPEGPFADDAAAAAAGVPVGRMYADTSGEVRWRQS